MEKVYQVVGMSCGNCVKHVKQALESVAGVKQVVVSLDTMTARVQGDYDEQEAVDAVFEQGYQLVI